MPSIEEQALQIYQNNLAYFEQKQPRVFEKLASFDNAIANGYYQERYDLEYTEQGYFDVKERSSGNFLYGSDTHRFAQEMAKSVDMRKVDNIFIISPRHRFTDAFLKKAKHEPITSNNLSGVAEIIDFVDRQIPEDSTMRRLEKYIFFGIGLGTHIPTIDKKIHSDFYLLVEDDLELFRLSLFVTDYTKIAQKSELYFVIFEEDRDAKVIMEEFLQDGFMHNHYIKFIHMLHHSESKMRVFHEASSSVSHLLFPYHAYFNKFLRALDFMREGYRFINLNAIKQPLRDKPVLLLAAGPSLAKNLSWVKRVQDRYIVVALTSTLSTLEQEGIVPDIITHLDPYTKGSLPHLQALKNRDYFTKPIVLVGGQSPIELVEMFDKDRVFVYESGTNYKKGFGDVQATCVGSTTLLLSLIFDAKEIYLLGLDLAIDEESGSTHTSSHAHAQRLDTSKSNQLEEIFNFKESLIKVKGNFKNEVLTTANFYISIESIERNIPRYKRAYQHIYNLNQGASLRGVEPKKIDEVEVPDLQEKHDLYELFLRSSSGEVIQEELESIEKILHHARKVGQILNRHKLKKFQSSEAYQYDLMQLSLDLTADRSIEASYLNLILLHYMQYIYPYIFDYLNTKEVKDYRKGIKVIDKILVSKMKKMVQVFERKCEQFFETEMA